MHVSTHIPWLRRIKKIRRKFNKTGGWRKHKFRLMHTWCNVLYSPLQILDSKCYLSFISFVTHICTELYRSLVYNFLAIIPQLHTLWNTDDPHSQGDIIMFLYKTPWFIQQNVRCNYYVIFAAQCEWQLQFWLVVLISKEIQYSKPPSGFHTIDISDKEKDNSISIVIESPMIYWNLMEKVLSYPTNVKITEPTYQ